MTLYWWDFLCCNGWLAANWVLSLQEETSRANCLQREIAVKMAKGSQSTMAKPVTGPSSTKSGVAQGFCMHMSGLERDKCAGDGISLVLPVLGLLFSWVLGALSVPEQVFGKRLILEVKCMEMATNLCRKGQLSVLQNNLSPLPTQSSQWGSDKSFSPLSVHKAGPYYLFICKAFFFPRRAFTLFFFALTVQAWFNTSKLVCVAGLDCLAYFH